MSAVFDISRFTAKPTASTTAMILFGLWLFATAFNIDKAYHVDDTAYLEMARWIAQNPLHPMSGLLSWGADYGPIHFTNQPPLYFYLMAGWGLLFGWSEIAMHTLMSIFTFWVIWGFYRLARIVTPDAPLLPTALLALSPAFVVSQNTMVDIPLLALWIEFFRVLLDPNVSGRWRYLFAGVLCGLAMLIKYTSLVLLPVLVLHILIVGYFAQLAWVLLPISILAAWSGFNYWEYGGIHMAGRTVASKPVSAYLYSALYWVSVLGAITPFAGLFFYARQRYSKIKSSYLFWNSVLILFCGAYLVFFCWLFAFPDRHAVNIAIQFLFLLTGFSLLGMLIAAALKKILNKNLNANESVLLCWIFTAAGFIVVLAPFMAERHVMLALPPILLLCDAWFVSKLKPRWVITAALVFTVLLTALLASADRWYADIYRNQAERIRDSLPVDATVWFNSNWGWQWYAQRAGMRMYSNLPDHQSPRAGDYFVTTEKVCCALALPVSLKFEPIKTVVIDRATRVQRLASISFYSSGWQAWGYSYEPIEKFQILRVVKSDKDN